MEKNKVQENEEYYNRVVNATLRIGFIAMLFILSYLILKPFLLMVVWAIIIAVGVYPIFEKLALKMGNKEKLTATLLVVVAVAVIIIPSILMLNSTIDSVQSLKEGFNAGTLTIPPPPENVAEWPVIGKSLYGVWSAASDNLEETLIRYTPQIKEIAPGILDAIAGMGGTILLTIISIIIAGVLLLKAEPAEKATHRIFKLLIGKDGEEITKLSKLTIRSVVQGILGIAIIQSVAAGLLMLAFGIPGAGIIALIVLFLAIVQLPPTIILLPVAIYAFGIMDTTPAVIFLILAMLVSVSDTLLKPFLLGRGVDVPMLIILLGAIGGMIAFGILGLFIGAVILAIAYKVFQALLDESVWIK